MTHTRHYQVHEVVGYVNWLYFFHAWGFPARYGSIARVHGCVACRQNWLQSFPEHERERASEAVKLYDEACAMLRRWDEAGFHTHFRVRLEAANSSGEDILLPEACVRLPLLRQQNPAEGQPSLCLADFVRPVESGVRDTIGLFVSTADEGLVNEEGNDYRRLLAQTLADRLAEATAEFGHQQTRREWWGYAPQENLTVDDLFAEKYQGKRPAVGYPSLPDQSLCFILSDLLDFPSLGISLTENAAMVPHASTCGLMISHPQACHFSIGRVGADQMADYAGRRGMKVEEAMKFIG